MRRHQASMIAGSQAAGAATALWYRLHADPAVSRSSRSRSRALSSRIPQAILSRIPRFVRRVRENQEGRWLYTARAAPFASTAGRSLRDQSIRRGRSRRLARRDTSRRRALARSTGAVVFTRAEALADAFPRGSKLCSRTKEMIIGPSSPARRAPPLSAPWRGDPQQAGAPIVIETNFALPTCCRDRYLPTAGAGGRTQHLAHEPEPGLARGLRSSLLKVRGQTSEARSARP
jgi:hypothetical protein